MMRVLLSVFTPVLLACGLNASDMQQSKHSDYVLIHRLYNTRDELLGNVYVKYINQNVFTSLLITSEIDGRCDTLYFIDSTKLLSRKGVDIEVYKDGFYGYQVMIKNKDYLVLNYLRNFGENVSDDITIEWNYKEELFEMMRVP